MGFLDFVGGGGSGLITGLAGTIAGAVSGKKDRDLQKELQQQQMEYGREMYALQSADENRRMEQQNQWNKEAAAQSQEYAKEMFDYTGYENQVKQMKAAGLNPALLNGAGSAGQAHGATVSPATAMQPMGLQVALQAQQTAAQTALTNAQAEKIRSENCIIGGASAISGHLNIADNVTLTGMSMVTNNISESGKYSSGIGLFENRKWKRTVVRLRQLADVPLTQLVKRLDDMQSQIESLESTFKLRK